MVIMVAKEVLWITVSDISLLKVSVLKSLMNTLIKMVLVEPLPVLNPTSLSPDILMSTEVPSDLKKPSKNNQFLLLLMLKNGLYINLVSMITVVNLLIMVSYLLVLILKNLGSSKTLGVHLGVKKVISDLNLVTLV